MPNSLLDYLYGLLLLCLIKIFIKLMLLMLNIVHLVNDLSFSFQVIIEEHLWKYLFHL